jgi:omega-hydroxy-beta-dihydromenaquinone-9 sulfotransferase
MGGSNSFLASLLRFYSFSLTSIWKEYHSLEYSLTWRRVLILISVLLGFPLLMAWNHLGFIFDDIFFPNWRNQQIFTPIFIVGNARSGTTWLHRLLTLIFEKQFTTIHTWEILFATSVSWRLLFHGIYFLDQYTGSLLSSFVFLLESLLISKSALHEIGLKMAEEDEWLMLHISKAQLMCFFFPCGGEVLGPLISLDTASCPSLSPSEKIEIFQFYRECMQRHLYAQTILIGNIPRIFVSKNPSFTLRIRTLFEIFPDCKIICLLRDPADSIPSMVSYLAAVFHLFASPCHKYPNTETLIGYCVSHYTYPLGLSLLPSLF